jgi:hypothetical protein
MDRFVRGMCVVTLLWVTWVGIAVYVASTRALPDAQPIHLAAADPWCNFTPQGPLFDQPDKYDHQMYMKIWIGALGIIAALAVGSVWASNRSLAMLDDIDWFNA